MLLLTICYPCLAFFVFVLYSGTMKGGEPELSNSESQSWLSYIYIN